MDVLITGGAGFVGLRLAEALARRGSLGGEQIGSITLFDRSEPESMPAACESCCTAVAGDIANRSQLAEIVKPGMSVFHLASVLSGEGEEDFDLAMRVNLEGMLALFETVRKAGDCRLVLASTIAVFGGDMPQSLSDRSKQTPQTTYGTTKAIGELLVNDYSRRGFIDARSARLPTVIVRPGKPNKAASSFASGVFREPLAGSDYVLPVREQTPMPLIGCRTVVEGIIAVHDLDSKEMGADRAVGLPALNVTVGDMVACLERLRGKRTGIGKVTIKPDPFIENICNGWPASIDNSRALQLGLPQDASLDEAVEQYIEDYLGS